MGASRGMAFAHPGASQPSEARQFMCESWEMHAGAADVESGSEAELLELRKGAGHSSAISRPPCLQLSIAMFALVALLAGLVLCFRSGRHSQQQGSPSDVVIFEQLNSAPSSTGGCDIDEELFGGLCYGKCAILTQQQYPIRTSAMTCCSAHPCGFFNQKHDVGICSGFSVAGGSRGNCPHPPGGCAANEEMHLGECYKKCSILTGGDYKYRVAAATCCKEDSEIFCLIPGSGKSKTSFDFSVNGQGGSPNGPEKGPANRTAAPATGAPDANSAAAPPAATAVDDAAEVVTGTSTATPGSTSSVTATGTTVTTTQTPTPTTSTATTAASTTTATETSVITRTETETTTIKETTATVTETTTTPPTTTTIAASTDKVGDAKGNSSLDSHSNKTQARVPSWAQGIMASAHEVDADAPADLILTKLPSTTKAATTPRSGKEEEDESSPSWLRDMARKVQKKALAEPEHSTESPAKEASNEASETLDDGSTTPKAVPLPDWAKEYLSGSKA